MIAALDIQGIHHAEDMADRAKSVSDRFSFCRHQDGVSRNCEDCRLDAEQEAYVQSRKARNVGRACGDCAGGGYLETFSGYVPCAGCGSSGVAPKVLIAEAPEGKEVAKFDLLLARLAAVVGQPDYSDHESDYSEGDE